MVRCPECKFKLPVHPASNYSRCTNCNTLVNVSTRKTLEFTPTFHHSDFGSKDDALIEYDEEVKVAKTSSLASVPCVMCGNPTSELFSTQGSILVVRTRKEVYTELDENGVEVQFERYIKFPTYKAGYVCDDDLMAFTEMCCAYDVHNHVKAKLKYVKPQESKLSDDIIQELDARKEFERWEDGTPITPSEAEESLIEYDPIKRPIKRELKFKPFEFEDASIQERASRKSKVQRQRPEVVNVVPKPSKKVRDMRKMVKG